MKYAEVSEGKTRLLVPPASLVGDAPPTSPVFFNPAASVNRDVSVAVTEAAEGRTFCDSMAGIGARGIRVAAEVKKVARVTLVDFNAEAVRVARRTAALNRVRGKCLFQLRETNSFLSSRYGRESKFDFVDVDPFGTPVRHLQAAISATAEGGLLSVTATDTAALCGVYPRVAHRRYGATPLNNHFHHETGVRILAGAVVRCAAAMEVGAAPVIAHATRHYIRVYLRLEQGATKADRSLSRQGYLAWCPTCGHSSSSSEKSGTCQKCGKAARFAGPLWIGALTDAGLVRRAADGAQRRGFSRAEKILRSLDDLDGFPPWSFSIDEACSSLGIATVAEAAVREELESLGYKSGRQPFETAGLKTDAPYDEFKEAVRVSARVGVKLVSKRR